MLGLSPGNARTVFPLSSSPHDSISVELRRFPGLTFHFQVSGLRCQRRHWSRRQLVAFPQASTWRVEGWKKTTFLPRVSFLFFLVCRSLGAHLCTVHDVPAPGIYLCSAPSAARTCSRSSARPSHTLASPESACRPPHSGCLGLRSATATRGDATVV